jgi:hypothetical protein
MLLGSSNPSDKTMAGGYLGNVFESSRFLAGTVFYALLRSTKTDKAFLQILSPLTLHALTEEG